jgi:hypothetical protein
MTMGSVVSRRHKKRREGHRDEERHQGRAGPGAGARGVQRRRGSRQSRGRLGRAGRERGLRRRRPRLRNIVRRFPAGRHLPSQSSRYLHLRGCTRRHQAMAVLCLPWRHADLWQPLYACRLELRLRPKLLVRPRRLSVRRHLGLQQRCGDLPWQSSRARQPLHRRRRLVSVLATAADQYERLRLLDAEHLEVSLGAVDRRR